ncbi:ABC transporter substrate-binding protein [Nonomuraea africana]|uniref:Multiple sugar transport system substrate-binding protein n=1 Tax=Nonomuraea africana TaxID=46171 RepID=A0ABR9K6X7_9ACTN|nr:sugar ABC transporter substrate-binding protein [Nonomuraea africana]MBE1557518.1 multiple sugar transport system substrate-binding protein [Nonomuraea africana]
MRFRMLVFGLATVLTVASTAACSGSGQESGPVTIRLGFYAAAGDPADKTMRELIKEFQAANPSIRVELEVAPYMQFFQRVRTQIAGGKAPDVWLSDGVLVQEFAARNALTDLSERIKGVNAADFHGLDLAKDAKGRVFGFPQGAQTPVLFYNKKMFAEAKVEEPTAEWTYDDLAAAAKKLTKDANGDGKPELYGLRAYSPGFTESWWPIIKAFGGDIVSDGNSKVIINSPQSVAALEWMRTAMGEGGFAPDVVNTHSMGSPHAMFATGRVAMSYGIYARSLTAKNAGVDYGVAPLPKGQAGRGNVAIVNSWVISKTAQGAKADAAWKWITYFSGEGPQKRWAKLGEAIPINKRVAAAETPGVFLDALADADDLGTNAVWSEYTEALTKRVNEALSGTTPVADALATGQNEAQQAIDRFIASQPK